MIIVGNSHVGMFVRPGRPTLAGGKPVHAVWVGQVSALTFMLKRPEAELVRGVFSRAQDRWKLLVIGDLDVLWSLYSDARDRSGRGLENATKQLVRIFDELGTTGRFAWVVGPQVRAALPGIPAWMRETYEHRSRAEIWARARALRTEVGRACEERGIPVIDPTDGFIADDGSSRPGYFRDDDAHLRPEHVHHYTDEIAAKLGEQIEIPPPTPAEQGPWLGSAARTELRRQLAATQLREHVQLKLAALGMELELDDATDFGILLDSLALTEVFSFALELQGLENTFAVDVREIATVRDMVDYMFTAR
ncbi:MAG TPA: hypothetical protein VGM39_12865 [Kofleriaceae bacterium]|jgi:hypothetical protein